MIKKLAVWILLICTGIFLTGCAYDAPESDFDSGSLVIFTDAPTEIDKSITESVTEEQPDETEIQTEEIPESTAQEFEPPEDEPLPASVEKDGSYTSPEDVAAYIHTFSTLPSNFITKKQAQALGWDNKQGNLADVAPGKSIGGDTFGNREGLLPDGKYHECDVNYTGGFRGSERIIYSDDGRIYYTNDHYQTFEQLY